jgi:hypothetical protein
MAIIKIPEDKREEVLTILLQNGNFSSLDKNTFVIEENAEETIGKIKSQGIEVKIIDK